MVALKKGQYGLTGIDVFDRHDMNRVMPERYIVAHVLGNMSRRARSRMYFCMLKQALWAGNDELASYAFNKCVLLLERKRETISEPKERLWETGWDEKAKLRHQKSLYWVFRLCRAIVLNKAMYQKDEESSSRDIMYKVRLEKTWKIAIGTTMDILVKNSRFNEHELLFNQKLVSQTYNFLHSILICEVQAKAMNISWFGSTSHFSDSGSKIVLESWRNSVNCMPLQQVVYFLENYPRIPQEISNMLRIEYARKGGAFDLKGPSIR